MAFEEKNTAYDFSLFEASPAPSRQAGKDDNIVTFTEEQLEKNRRIKYKPIKVLTGIFFSALVLAIVGVMVYSQVQLTELTAQINSQTKVLSESRSLNTQLSMKLESSMSLRVVEDYAKTELGMRAVQSDQIEYISLSEGDKAQTGASEQQEGLLDRISEAISGLLS